MTQLAPFTLQPIFVERPWGGSKLADYGKDLPDGVHIGESWEVADLPQHVAPTVENPSNLVLDGPFAGDRLGDVVSRADNALLGPVSPTADGRFPMLFKLLDAREHLSVQVHPPAEYVADHPEARLKTESWYVVEAATGGVLYLDVNEGVTRADLDAVLGTGGIVPLLRQVPAIAGAFHHVPAGLIHALGAGTLVAEVQTPSDTTFRIYDWSTEYGRAPRDLHTEQARASIRIDPPEAYSRNAATEAGVHDLVSNQHYWMREHRVDGHSDLTSTEGPVVLNVTAGSLALGDLELAKGSTAIVPASADVQTFETTPGTVVMEMGF